MHVIYPVVAVQVEGGKCRALLDTGAGRSYASAKLLDRLSSHRIKMMLGATREVELSTIDISATDGKFSLPVEVTKVNKGELLFPMDDLDTKDQLPVHLIFGAGKYAKIKTESAPRVSQPGQPLAKLTSFGWAVISQGKEPTDLSNMLLTQMMQITKSCVFWMCWDWQTHLRKTKEVYTMSLKSN